MNLLPMAVQLPDAHFVGVDLSSLQTEDGQRVVEQLGLGAASMTNPDPRSPALADPRPLL